VYRLTARGLNHVVTNIYDEGLRPFGLKITQRNILVAFVKMKDWSRPSETENKL